MNFSKRQLSDINVLLFAVPFLMGIGIDLYVPSLPMIVKDFQVAKQWVQMTIATYLLGYGIGQIILGVASDFFGRRKIIIASACLYLAISTLVVLATPTIGYLNFYRFIQGVAIAGLAVVIRAIATDCYQGVSLHKAMTFLSTSFALGPIVGPLIGAYLQHYFSWRANFYFFAFYGLFILLYALTKLPETLVKPQVWQFRQITNNITTILFHQFFCVTAIWASLIYGMLVIFNVVGPFLIQDKLHYSVIYYGNITFILGFSYFFGTLVNRFLLNYYSPSKNIAVSILGILLCSISLFVFSWCIALNLYSLITPIWLTFFLCGIAFPNGMAKSLGLFPQYGGTASAIFGTWTGIVVGILTALCSSFRVNTQAGLAIALILMTIGCLIFFVRSRFLEISVK